MKGKYHKNVLWKYIISVLGAPETPWTNENDGGVSPAHTGAGRLCVQVCELFLSVFVEFNLTE